MHGFDIIESKDPLKDIVKIIEADKLETIGFDNQVSFAYYQGLQAIFEGYTLSPQSNFMEELRMIKDEKELATIRKACSISAVPLQMCLISLNQVKQQNYKWLTS